MSNFVGTTAFAAINLIMPYIMLFGMVGIMVGTGGTALISKTLGEGKEEKANELFSMLVYLSIAGGVVLTVLALLLLRPVAISFLRMLVFQAAGVLLLPVFFDLEGVWWSIVVAEAGALFVTGFCFAKYRGRYHF